MKKIKLPLTIDAFLIDQKRLDYDGIYTAEQVVRLTEAVVRVDSDVQIFLSFNIDNQRLKVISGSAEVAVMLMCQRCWKPFKNQIRTTFCFNPGFNNDKRVEVFPEGNELIDVDKFGRVNLLAMVEDEIILALPIAPVHDSEHCKTSEADIVFGKLPDEVEKSNPFSILSSLRMSD
ncbi:MAG: 23S rRNA accumulation protein YceD [Candidatus Malihini olakiniferum]